MKHKTADLSQGLLDAAVAKAAGIPFLLLNTAGENSCRPGPYCVAAFEINSHVAGAPVFEPNCRWEHAGPIIERERIVTLSYPGEAGPRGWEAAVDIFGVVGGYTTASDPRLIPARAHGPTPLIAAMRAFVRSELGDEVELP